MAITIPNRKLVRPTVKHIPKPNTAKSKMVNPGPVGIATTGASSSGTALMEPTITWANYIGFNVRSDVPDGGIDEESFSPVSGCPVEGFAGVSPGVLIYIDPTARPDPESTFSGLTHTAPTVVTGRTAGDAGPVNTAKTWEAIGIGWTTTKIYIFAR